MRSVEGLFKFGASPQELRSSPRRVLFLSAYLWSAGIFISVQMPLTSSGVVALYGSDFVAVPDFAIAGMLLWRRRSEVSRSIRVFGLIYFAFFALCVSVFFYRFAGEFVDLQSLVIPRGNLASSAILVLIVLGLFSARELLLSAYLFSVTMALAAAPLAVYDIYLPFSVFENLAVRTDVQLFLMPVLLLGLVFGKRFKLGNAFNWAFALCLASLIFCATISGARVNAVLVPMVVVLAIVALLFVGEGKKRTSSVLVSVLIPVTAVAILIVAVAPSNARIQYGLERNILFSAISDALDPAPAVPAPTSRPVTSAPVDDPPIGSTDDHDASAAPDEANIEFDAEQSLEASTSSRSEVWAKAWTGFTDNALFGTGLKQFPVTYAAGDETFTSTIQPHNFVIEYLMSYGLAGLALWLALLLYWPARSAIAALSKSRMALFGVGALGATFAIVFGASFFQPLMLYPTILLIFYFAIGTISRVLDNESPLSKSPESGREGSESSIAPQ